MKRVECEFESEVLAALLEGRWPEHVDPALSAHAAECAICSDVAAIAGCMAEAREHTHASAEVPDAARVWWRARMRARREAVTAAGRPITAAQVIAFGCSVGLVGACFGATSTWFQAALTSIRSTAARFDLQSLIASASALSEAHGALLLVSGAMLVVIPAAVYLAVLRD